MARHTSTRTLAPALVALLVVFSGCSLLGGPPSATPSPNSSPAPAAGDVPGVSNGRLTDPAALLSAHRTALVDGGFEADFRVNVTLLRRGQVVAVPQRQRTVVAPGATEYRYRLVGSGGAFVADAWGNRSVEALRVQSGNRTQYRTGQPASPAELTGTIPLSNYLSLSSFAVTDTYRRNGTALVELSARGARNVSSVLPANATDVGEYDATLVVDATGRVREFRASVDYTVDGERATYVAAYALVHTDVSAIPRPKWVGRALGG